MGKKIEFDKKTLPQNVRLIGEKEEKNIYISIKAYNKVHNFTKNKFDSESGGILIGEFIEVFNSINIVIYDFIEAKYTESTKTTLTFTHKTWEFVHGEIEKKYENAHIVGWIHTHPGFGIFLSDYDKFIQDNFFSNENQVAYVVDPVQKTEGFFTIINGKLQKCKGFYVFDELGKEINIENDKNSIEKDNLKNNYSVNNSNNHFFHYLKSVLLILLIIINVLMFYYYNNRINKLTIDIADAFNMVNNKFQTINNNILNIEYKMIDWKNINIGTNSDANKE